MQKAICISKLNVRKKVELDFVESLFEHHAAYHEGVSGFGTVSGVQIQRWMVGAVSRSPNAECRSNLLQLD